MTRFTVQLAIAATPEQVWDLVTDWTAHERWIPMTRVRILSPSPTGMRARFVARTGLGPFSVDDVMEVTAWAPPTAVLPGRFAVVKEGRIVHGGASFDVRSVPAPDPATSAGGVCEGSEGSLVTWSEELKLAPERLTWALGPVIGGVGRLGLVRALRTMKHELES